MQARLGSSDRLGGRGLGKPWELAMVEDVTCPQPSWLCGCDRVKSTAGLAPCKGIRPPRPAKAWRVLWLDRKDAEPSTAESTLMADRISMAVRDSLSEILPAVVRALH